MQQLSGNKSESTPTVIASSFLYVSPRFHLQAPPSTTTASPSAPAPAVVPPPPPAAPPKKPVHPSPSTITKKDAAKKATLEIHRKKQGLLEEQIQQQKLLLKKLESAETNTEKESIRSLMKQVDATIVRLKDSLQLTPAMKPAAAAPVKPPTNPKMSQQDALKQRAKTLQKQIESLRAKTSADMVSNFC